MDEGRLTIEKLGQMLSDYAEAMDLPPWEKIEYNPPTKATGFVMYIRRTDRPEDVLDHLEDKLALCIYVNKRMAGETPERPQLKAPFVLTDDMDDDTAFRSAADFLKGGQR